MRAIDGVGRPIRRALASLPPIALRLVIAGLLVTAGCSVTGDSWPRIKESGTLRIGIDPTFPPFALDDGGSLAGIDVDIGRALAAEVGLEPEFVYFGYDGLYDALTTSQVDVLISALVIAPERTKDIAYTNTYFDAGLILIRSTDDDAATGMEVLDSSTVAVELGALGHVEALEWQRRMGGLTILPFSDVGEAISAVATGDARVALVDSVSGYLYLRQQSETIGRLEIAPEVIISEPYAMAVRIDDRVFLAELNNALGRLADSGELADIIDHHLGR